MSRAVWGRDRGLTLAAQVLDPALAAPVALVLGGEDGVGKTTVWEAIISMAQERGYRVLSAGPVESKAAIAVARIADLLRNDIDEVLPGEDVGTRAGLVDPGAPGLRPGRRPGLGGADAVRARTDRRQEPELSHRLVSVGLGGTPSVVAA